MPKGKGKLKRCPSVPTMVRNIVGAVRTLDVDEKSAALGWYPEARIFVQEAAAEYNYPPAIVAGVMAAFSPRTQWIRNKRLTLMFLDQPNVRQPGTMEKSQIKAMRILGGEPANIVFATSPKCRAFYRACLGDDDAVVVDVWALRAATHTRVADNPDIFYSKIELAYRKAARRLRMPPAVVQAMAWIAERGKAT